MATSQNGRYEKDSHSGAYSAGVALGIALRPEIASVVLLGVDLAFRVVSQVLLDAGQLDAASLVDRAVASFVRGYHHGKAKGERHQI